MTCFPSLFSSRSKSAERTREPNEGIHNVKLYSFKELRDATKDFSPAEKIGQGGFGAVYKGKLKDGKIAAIKVLSAESQQGLQEFLTEIRVIWNIQHENLVKLYGCCVEGSHRILVYNYLENNSLARALLGDDRCESQFSWQARSAICIGIARGLAYLHEVVKPYIVHRDIKASNILLDKNLTPKISDFGFAKLFPSNVTHLSTRVAGTIGYLAPEYAISGQLTRKADIYSFGVLLLEIVSGRCNTLKRLPTGEQNLLELAWELYERNELILLVDSSLDGYFDAEEALRYLKIALLCTQDSPKLRPSMSTVVKMLTGEVPVSKKIRMPGLISDFMDLKARNPQEGKKLDDMTFSIWNSTISSGTSTFEATTFSEVHGR